MSEEEVNRLNHLDRSESDDEETQPEHEIRPVPQSQSISRSVLDIKNNEEGRSVPNPRSIADQSLSFKRKSDDGHAVEKSPTIGVGRAVSNPAVGGGKPTVLGGAEVFNSKEFGTGNSAPAVSGGKPTVLGGAEVFNSKAFGIGNSAPAAGGGECTVLGGAEVFNSIVAGGGDNPSKAAPAAIAVSKIQDPELEPDSFPSKLPSRPILTINLLPRPISSTILPSHTASRPNLPLHAALRPDPPFHAAPRPNPHFQAAPRPNPPFQAAPRPNPPIDPPVFDLQGVPAICLPSGRDPAQLGYDSISNPYSYSLHHWVPQVPIPPANPAPPEPVPPEED